MKRARPILSCVLLSVALIAAMAVAARPAAAKSHWLSGALIGLGTGATAGIGIGYAACSGDRSSGTFCTNRPAGMTYLGVGFGGLGFAGGALTGSHFKKGPPADKAGKALDPSAVKPAKVPEGFVRVGAPPSAGEPFIVDLRYAQPDNFLGRNIYAEHGVGVCWLHPLAANRLRKLVPSLKRHQVRLILWDCWRPVEVQREMWKIVPDERFVANPDKGSNHNRGLAVDATLADESGRPLEMPTSFDDFSERAAKAFACPENQRQPCTNRDLLIRLMKGAGFATIESEWWHFQTAGVDLESYPVW